MDDELKNLLKDLLSLSSPSGEEEFVTAKFMQFLRPYCNECYIDSLGNCIAHKKGNGPKILLMAHADEIGLMVHYIDDKGFLYFKEIGGIDTSILPGRKVRIKGNEGVVYGVIGKKPIHLQDKSSALKELNAEDLWIDIAAKDKNEASHLVSIGAVATIVSDSIQIQNTCIAAKSLDDRIGLAVLAGVAKTAFNTKADIYYVASVQEELGSRGAQAITYSIMPDMGIAIDVTHATDYPTMSPTKDGDISLGKGVVIAFGPNMDKGISNGLKQSAESASIAYQVEAMARPTGTDAKMIQVTGSGIKTGLLSIPCRYMHTPNEIISLNDADAAIHLLTEYLKSFEN